MHSALWGSWNWDKRTVIQELREKWGMGQQVRGSWDIQVCTLLLTGLESVPNLTTLFIRRSQFRCHPEVDYALLTFEWPFKSRLLTCAHQKLFGAHWLKQVPHSGTDPRSVLQLKLYENLHRSLPNLFLCYHNLSSLQSRCVPSFMS